MESTMGEVRGLITLVTLLAFLGICWWAFRSRNRERFEEDARLPFLDDETGPEDEARRDER